MAIVGLKVTDHDGINKSGHNYLDGMYALPLVYDDPPMEEAEYKALVLTSDDLTAKAKKGDTLSKTKRNDASKKVFDVIKFKFCPYLNNKFPGNKAMFEQAGANVSAEPVPVPPPDQPIISKIVRGPEEGSIKVNLVRGKNSKLKKRSTTEYIVYLFAKPDDKTGKEIGDSTDSRKLYGYGVTADVYVWIAVRAKNSGGSSLLSEKTKFFLQSE